MHGNRRDTYAVGTVAHVWWVYDGLVVVARMAVGAVVRVSADAPCKRWSDVEVLLSTEGGGGMCSGEWISHDGRN